MGWVRRHAMPAGGVGDQEKNWALRLFAKFGARETDPASVNYVLASYERQQFIVSSTNWPDPNWAISFTRQSPLGKSQVGRNSSTN
jgi:hypothetical protein